MKAIRNGSFALSGEKVDLNGKKAYVPIQMYHDSVEIEVLEEPTIIAEGIVSIGNISRAIWGMG